MEKSSFGTKLIEIRKAKGLTQEEVASKCNITVRTIQRIESGIVTPRAFTIKIISEALGFDFYGASNTGYDASTQNENSKLNMSTILWYLKDLFNLKTHTMEKISILTTSFLMIGFALFLCVSKAQAQSDNKKVFKSIVIHYNSDKSIKRVEVRFSNYLNFDSLVFIKKDLKGKGIIIDYKKINFDEKGNLSEINCEVKSILSGESGNFAQGFLNAVNKNKKTGFFYDFSKGAKTSFCAGGCDL